MECLASDFHSFKPGRNLDQVVYRKMNFIIDSAYLFPLIQKTGVLVLIILMVPLIIISIKQRIDVDWSFKKSYLDLIVGHFLNKSHLTVF